MAGIFVRILIPAIPYVLAVLAFHIWQLQLYAAQDHENVWLQWADLVTLGFYIIATTVAALVSYATLQSRYNIGISYFVRLIFMWIGIGIVTVVPQVLFGGDFIAYPVGIEAIPAVAASIILGVLGSLWLASGLLRPALQRNWRGSPTG